MNKQPPFGLGILTLVTMLLVVSLSVLSLLAYLTARNDALLTQAHAQSMQSYYAADAKAVLLYEQFQAESDAFFSECIPFSTSQALRITFERRLGHEVAIVAWQTESILDEDVSPPLNIWSGDTLPR